MVKIELSHVAFLVNSVEESAKIFSSSGIKIGEPEIFESEGTKEIYIGEYKSESGLLLLLEPVGPGPYSNTMKKRGPSLHHFAIDVLDLRATLNTAQEMGWLLHPISEKTIRLGSAWLFMKGKPGLIEINEKRQLLRKPRKITAVGFSNLKKELFEAIGIGDIIKESVDRFIMVDGKTFSMNQFVR